MSSSPDLSQGVNFLPMGIRYSLPRLELLFKRKAAAYVAVFAVLFLCLKANQFLFFHYDTSPAVLFIPTGIALAAILLGGYRLATPIAVAWFLATITSPGHPTVLFTLLSTIGYTLQAVIGRYMLNRFGYSGTLGRTKDALLIVGVALLLPIVGPTLTTIAQWLGNSLTTSAWVTFSRAWAGGVLNILVFTPLITAWSTQSVDISPRERLQSFTALACLTLVTYLTYWTALPTYNMFIVIYLLFAVLFWIGLKLQPRFVAAAIALVSIFGTAGSIVSPTGIIPITEQLLSDELFIILIAPIFYILGALVEEGRINAEVARTRAREVEAVNKRLSLDDQAKNEFLATLAHELRNPLAPVVSSLELLKIGLTEVNRPDLLELVQIADAHNLTLTHLLDDLLDVSRISRKKFKLQKVSTKVEPLVEQARRTVEALYSIKGHTLFIVLTEPDVWVEADPLRLEQILVNLLNNAGKYTEPGGTITLTTRREERNLRIEVRDTGIGIEQEMLAKIFEPFVQTSTHSAGLGIGLSLTKRLVELHGGTISVESPGLGKGSTFTVVLPGAANVQIALAVPAHRARNEVSRGGKVGSKAAYRILIVDDNVAAARGLEKLLSHGGHTVSSVYNGSDALVHMQTNQAQVVLLDIGMPDMDGYTVAKLLRQQFDTTALVLVALTGYGQEDDKKKAEEAGFNYHLTKPVSSIDIESVLATVDFNTPSH
ncbi:MAG: Multi-sensor hybrid histidine kinase [Parcubacteria group bacterium]|nr:Multi-sensor hybrid histidine kinase [Parcubacteria group bacterium]